MSSKIKLNSSSTKHAIIICSLIAAVIIIGAVVTITTRNKSTEINLQNYALKMKSIDPHWAQFVDEEKSLVNAFVAGTNIKSQSLYVCRVNRTGSMEILPGIYSSEQKSCIVTCNYRAHEYEEFEILIAEDPSIFVWKANSDDGYAPNGALIGGISKVFLNNYQNMIARVQYSDGDQNIGSLTKYQKEVQVPLGKYTQKFKDYQVLCLKDYSLV